MGWIAKVAFYGLGGLMAMSMCSKLTKQAGSGASPTTHPALASNAVAATQTKTVVDAAPIEKPERVTASRVASDFAKNEVSAEDRYRGRCFDLTGTVARINANTGDEATLVLRADAVFLGVTVSDVPRAFAASLSKGDLVTLAVKGISEVLGQPVASFSGECADISSAAEDQEKAKKAAAVAEQKAKREAAKAAKTSKGAKGGTKGQSKERLELPCKPGQKPPCYQ